VQAKPYNGGNRQRAGQAQGDRAQMQGTMRGWQWFGHGPILRLREARCNESLIL
jgi:hypothetical protein